MKRTHKYKSISDILTDYPNIKLSTDECHTIRSNGAKVGWINNYDNYKKSRELSSQDPVALYNRKLAMNKSEVDRKLSDSMKRRWSDPSSRDLLMRSLIDKWYSTDKCKESVSLQMKLLWSDEVYATKMRDNFSSSEYRSKLSKSLRDSYTDERRKKISDNNKLRWMNRNLTPNDKFTHSSYRVDYVLYNGNMYRSSWEVHLAKVLDKLSIIYEYESLSIQYYCNGCIRTYIPDFYLPEYNLILEVKPFEFIHNEVVQSKKLYSILDGYDYIFITTKVHKDIERILKKVQRLSKAVNVTYSSNGNYKNKILFE